MKRDDFIYKLKELISEYEDDVYYLEEMIDDWEKHDDPCSDPGLQYEKELEVDRSFKSIIQFVKDNESIK